MHQFKQNKIREIISFTIYKEKLHLAEKRLTTEILLKIVSKRPKSWIKNTETKTFSTDFLRFT